MSAFDALADRIARPIAVTDVQIAHGRRRVDPAWVETLAEMIARDGQQSPIEVIRVEGTYRLVYGRHRLEAARRLGWLEIMAFIRLREDFATDAAITLREITENLARRELSVLDRAFDVARWRDLYEAAAGPVKRGRPRKLSQDATISDDAADRFAESFSEVARRALGMNRDAIARAMRIADLSDGIRDRISLHPIADNQAELLQLAGLPVARRADVVALLIAEPAQASTVAGAVAVLDCMPAPAPAPRWQKLSAAFSGLKQADRDAFFELHEEAIRAWLTMRDEA